MELFLLEHRRIWKRKSTRISAFLSFVYVVVFGCILSYQWFTFGSSDGSGQGAFSNRFDGYANIRQQQQYTGSFGGELTDETLKAMVGEYQKMVAAEDDRRFDRTYWRTLNVWLQSLYPELEDPGEKYPNLMVEYVEPEKLTGFYERRQRAVEDFLTLSNQTGKEGAYLLEMNERVEQPFRYQWTEGWSVILNSNLSDLGMVMALFLAIALSPVFAGEWHDRTGPLILTTKNGWRETARAKIFSGLALAAELFGMIMVGNVASQLFYLGTEGWDMPIQTIKLIAVAPMNMLQAELYGYTVGFLGAIGFAGLVLLLSACVKSTSLALILSLGAVYLPTMIARYLPLRAQLIMDLLPLVGSPTDVFRTYTFRIFGKYIWSPWLLLVAPILIGLACAPFAVRRWARRMRG